MPNSAPIKFKRSLIALSVLSLSACSSGKKITEVNLGDVGHGIAVAGKATARATRNTWNLTTYLLGFSDSRNGEGDVQEEELLIVENDSDSDEQLIIATAENLDDEVLVETAEIRLPAAVPVLPDESSANADKTSAVLEVDTDAQPDLIYEVGEGETLWDISRRTTGDANNWHALADINNLEQNAAVFPGQELLIPIELAKADSNLPVAESTIRVTVTEQVPVDDSETEVLVDNTQEVLVDYEQDSRLPVPDADASSDAVLIDAFTVEPDVADTASASPVESTQGDDQVEVAFELNDGETLWDLAKRSTGDATNWQAIADYNGFSESQAVVVRPGQTIYVPNALVKSRDESEQAESAAVISAPEATRMALNEEIEQVSDVASLGVSSTSASPEPAFNTAATTVQAIETAASANTAFSSDEALNVNTANLSDNELSENSNIPAVIMVSGTYFPKAVYNNADFSSSLLMRVSPGTTLQVSKAMGPWYEVETEEGVGYVHQRDIQ